MKRFLPLLLMAGCIPWLSANAEVLMQDDFAYQAGNLYQTNGRLRNNNYYKSPIQVVATPLAYAGYETDATSNAVKIVADEENSWTNCEQLKKYFTHAAAAGDVYVSLLVNVESVNDNTCFLGLIDDRGNNRGDQVAATDRGRLYAVKDGNSTDGFKFGVSKGSIGFGAKTDATFEFGKTYLVVVKYTFVSGLQNDVISLYVNPSATEPATADATASDSYDLDASGAAGLCLFGSLKDTLGPAVTVDAIRVATTWDELGINGGDSDALTAQFSSPRCATAAYSNGFDTNASIADWTQDSYYERWRISENPYSNTVPAFSSINPESTGSLYIARSSSTLDENITSPEITVPANAKLRFWGVFNPVWLYYAHTNLNITVDGTTTTLWNSFLWAQDNNIEDTKWTQHEIDLSQYAGKTVQFTFNYSGTDGDDAMFDDFEIVTTDNSDDAKVYITPGSSVTFTDMTEGEPTSWQWTFAGAEPATSNEQSPTVTYPDTGTFDVSLTVSDGAGNISTKTRTGFVVVRREAPQAAIGTPAGAYYSPEASLVVPIEVPLTFTDESKGDPDTRSWTFPGTDTPTSDAAEVTVKYLKAGTYDVDLTVSNEAGESSTYLYALKAGGENLIWNIPVEENTMLAPISLSWYGYYGGTNWLDMPGFAEHFTAPLAKITVSGVNVYFARATAVSTDADIVVSLTNAIDGLPGDALATKTLKASQLVDASETYNDPTIFTFDTPVDVETEFFITITGFPNANGDDIAMYCSPRRDDPSKSTVYHWLDDLDENNQPTGTRTWVKNVDESLSFAIAPRISFDTNTGIVDSVIDNEQGADTIYNLQGMPVPADRLTDGIYIIGGKKVLIKR